MKKLLPLILTAAALLAPSAALANDLSSLGFYELIYGNQPTSTVRKRTSAPAYENVYEVTPNAWLVSSAYWPAHRYCKSIYGVSNAMNSCMGQQRRLAGY